MDKIQQFNLILNSFNIKATCQNVQQVDSYIFYDVRLEPSAKVKDLHRYSDEISLALKTPRKPTIKVLREQGVVRLEFITQSDKTLKLFDLFTNDDVPKGGLIALLGQTVDGKKVWMDLAKNPHMLIAGTTGSGKSTLLHNIIGNMLNYNDCQMFLVDPKNIEFHEYNEQLNKGDGKLRVSYNYQQTIFMLDMLMEAMEERYELLRNNKTAMSSLPYLLLIIDEFADLIIQDKDDQFFDRLCRLAQKSRAAHISIILSTQRPSVNVVNGAIKANFPARISCKVSSYTDSCVVLGVSGAEDLLGRGDALMTDGTRYMERFQVAYTDATEVCKYFGSTAEPDGC